MFWRCYDYQMYIKHVFLESCDSLTWQWLTNLPTMYFLHVGQQFTWKRAFVTDVVFLWHTISYETDFSRFRTLVRAWKTRRSRGCWTRATWRGTAPSLTWTSVQSRIWCENLCQKYIYENLPTASQSKKHHCCKCKAIGLFLRLPQLNCKASHKCALSCVLSNYLV